MIVDERARQEMLHPLPVLKAIDNEDVNVIQNLLLQNEFLAVLIEEVGEVGKAVQGDSDLVEELTQVAAVCVRWLENLK
jgi:hypothetical protein